MSFRHGRFAEITYNGSPLSTFCDSADLDVKTATSDTTTFGKTWKTALTGLVDATVNLSGNYDPTITTGPQALIVATIGADPFAVVLYPGGNTTGQKSESFNAILTGYKETSKTTEKVIFTATLLVTGVVTFGTV